MIWTNMKLQQLNKLWKSAAFLLLGLCGYGEAQAQKNIQLENPSDFQRKELVSIPYSDFSKKFGRDTNIRILDEKGLELPLQFERLGKEEPQNLLVLLNLQPHQKMNLQVVPGKRNDPQVLTYARKVPERFDDFAWENNLVAFRIYGEALEGRADDAQGIDYWAKRTSNLIINKWYKTEDYHRDHGEGMDYYSVGQTLGLGDIGIWANDSLFYTKHYRGYQILDNGPLRTTFELIYEPQEIHGEVIEIRKRISLDADSRFNKLTISIGNKSKKDTEIAIGLVKRKEQNPTYQLSQDNRVLAYWEPEIGNNGHTAVALIVPQVKPMVDLNRKEQFLLKTRVKNNQPLTYFSAAAWDREGQVKSAEQWYKVVQDYWSARLSPIKVHIK